MITDFPRIKRLPPYVFGIVTELKKKARALGEDIIDFGMGNPDQPTPQHIVDKLVEAAQRPDTHRYWKCHKPNSITKTTSWETPSSCID